MLVTGVSTMENRVQQERGSVGVVSGRGLRFVCLPGLHALLWPLLCRLNNFVRFTRPTFGRVQFPRCSVAQQSESGAPIELFWHSQV